MVMCFAPQVVLCRFTKQCVGAWEGTVDNVYVYVCLCGAGRVPVDGGYIC